MTTVQLLAGNAVRHGALLLAALVLLSGCASFQANRPGVAERVELMLSEHEYARALETIALVKPSHPDYKRLQGWRQTIQKNARAWEAELVRDVEQMIEADQWYNAQQQLDEGLQKLPQSEALIRTQQRFLYRRGVRLAGINHRLTLARGRGLPAEIAALEELAAVDPQDAEIKAELARRRGMLADAQRDLVECGRTALSAGRTDRARECLTIARGIARSPDVEKMLATLEKSRTAKKQAQKQQQRQVQAAAQKRVERDQARKLEELQVAYNRALQNGDLNTARQHLDVLLKVQPTAALRQDSARLDQRIKRQVDRSMEDGRNLYTQGDFQGARAIWVAALRLDPGNQELKDNIARAERVLKKLKTLSDDQQNTN